MSSKIDRSLAILLSWRFLLCVLLILFVTSWVPLLAQTYTLQDEDGNILQEQTNKVRAWKSWTRIIHPRAADFLSHLYAVSVHLGICLVTTFIVWYLSPQEKKRAIKAETEQAVLMNEDGPDTEEEGIAKDNYHD